MEDTQIIDLYFERDEEDCKECVNDSCFKLWSAIPPTRPRIFKAFAGKITRNQALNMYEAYAIRSCVAVEKYILLC